jgi:protein involved in polysaccharide export with SLBB domain
MKLSITHISCKIVIALIVIGSILFSVRFGLCQSTMGESLQQLKANEDILNKYKTLSKDEKKRLFCNLSGEQKRELLIRLPDEDRPLVFDCLTSEDKSWVLKKIGPRDTVKLFISLDDIEQRLIFNELDDNEKRLFLNQATPLERSQWFLLYPELEELMDAEEIPSDEEEPDKEPFDPRAEKAKVPPSRIERILSGAFPEKIDRQLKQFGYDFFKKRDSKLLQTDDMPVDDDYILGPGDSFTIYVWGKVEQTYEVTVNRQGSIIVPRIGDLSVGGMAFGQAKSFLKRKLKEYYPHFELTVVMGKLRTMHVYFVGEAKQPGMHNVSALSTVMSALSAVGGPSKDGSLRKIRVVRAGGESVDVDLYDLLVFGNRKGDIRLQAGDTVFIPLIGPVAGVAGNVRRPAIYELKDKQSVGDIIELAGGALPFGYLQNVVVERIKDHHRRVVRSFSLDRQSPLLEANLKLPVRDGDVLKIYPVHRQMGQVVYLEGHVKYPEESELKPGMRLSDILTGYDLLLPEPYLPRADIFRLVRPDLHPEIIGFNLGAMLDGDVSQDLVLQDMDRIKIYSYREKTEVPTVTINGAVNTPGLYRLYENMTVRDLIFRAGNLSRRAYRTEASLSRVVPGEVGTNTVTIPFSPENAMVGTQPDDMRLKPNDIIFIREIPKYALATKRRVMLEGEFLYPGEYAFAEGERLSSVIKRAGGLTKDAYSFGAVFHRDDVKTIQQSRLKDYISDLEDDILTLSARTTEASLDKDEAEIMAKTLAAKKQLLEKMKTTEPTGRMVLDLDRVLTQPQSDFDFKLQPGDRLVVGKIPDFVNVLGEVYNQTAMLVLRGKKVSFYLDQVGGPTDDADHKQIYLVKANGTVISKRQEGMFGIASWDQGKNRWTAGGFESLKVDPGDTIIVPKKVDRYSWLRLTKSITEIMYQIAVAAGVLVVAF